MQCMEMAVAVLFPDTSFWQKCRKIRCQWLLCIGRLVSKHRQVMLPCTGEDYWCSFTTGQWGQHRSMFVLRLTGLRLFSRRALTWCICPTRVGTVGSCIAFEEDSPGVFEGLAPGRTLKQCRTHQSQSNVRMVGRAVSDPGVNFDFWTPGGPGGTWDLAELISCSGMDGPWRRSGMRELHAVKIACDLDVSWSPFGGCVTTLWRLRGFKWAWQRCDAWKWQWQCYFQTPAFGRNAER